MKNNTALRHQLMPPGMQHCVVMWEHADLHLTMEPEDSSEKLVLEYQYQIIQLTFQKAIILIFTAMETTVLSIWFRSLGNILSLTN